MPPASRRSRNADADEEEERRPRQRQRRAESESEDGEDEVEQRRRPKQRQRRAEPEDEDEEENEAEAEDAEQPAESADSQLIKKLVRYAMACDFSRTPIRRDGIKEKVLGDQGRAFRRVFDGAQKTLRAVFGMEMVELPVKEKLTKEEKRKAAKSQNKSTSSGTYVLASILPEPFRSAKIIAPSRLLSADDESAYVGFYTLIITLITLNGGNVSDSVLKKYFDTLNAEVNTFMDTKTEETLAKMLRQGYLIKHVNKEAAQHGDTEQATEWHVGPRGKVEVNNEAMGGLVRAVWDPKTADEAADLEKKLKASLHIREREPAQGRDEANADESRQEEEEEVAEVEERNGGSSRKRGRRRQAVEEEEDEGEGEDE